MVFAPILHKIKTEFELKKWEEFTAGVDVGHVSSATAASLWALEPTHIWKVGEYYHSNKDERFLEAVELAQEILAFFAQQKDQFGFQELDCFVDNADPGFISLLNTEARNFYTYTGKFCYIKLVFKSLNYKLADSGYSIANYVQPALPGSGWAWPVLKLVPAEKVPESQKNIARPYLGEYIIVEVDAEKTIDVGVWRCQIKIDNTAIIHSVRLMGYPATWDPGEGDKDKDGNTAYNTGFVFAPRPLFPKYFLPAVNHPLNTQLRAAEDFVLMVGIQPVIDFYINWKENKKSAYDESIKSSYEGHIRTNFAATNEARFSLPGVDSVKIANIWKNWVVAFKEKWSMPDKLTVWPEWLIERITYVFPLSVLRDV